PVAVLAPVETEQMRAAAKERGLTLVRSAEGRDVPDAGAAGALLGSAATLLVVAVDRPLVRPETLGALLAAHTEAGAVATMMAPGIGAFAAAAFLPLLEGTSPVATFDEAAARLAASGHAVRRFSPPDPQETLAV